MTIKPKSGRYFHVCYDKNGRSYAGHMHKNPMSQTYLVESLRSFVDDETLAVHTYNEFYKQIPNTPEFDRLREDILNVIDEQMGHINLFLSWLSLME